MSLQPALALNDTSSCSPTTRSSQISRTSWSHDLKQSKAKSPKPMTRSTKKCSKEVTTGRTRPRPSSLPSAFTSKAPHRPASERFGGSRKRITDTYGSVILSPTSTARYGNPPWTRSTVGVFTSAYKKLHPESNAKWRCPISSANVQGLSIIAGTREVLIDDDEPDITDDLRWRVSDLYPGITPYSLIQHWSGFFSTPAAITRTVIHKFVRYLADQAFEMIWKPRCKTTIEWEREQGITPAQKRAAHNGPTGDWDAGYGSKFGPNHCPCSRQLTDHADGQCPGPVRDPFLADHTLLGCWLGRQHRTIMGGAGKIPFL